MLRNNDVNWLDKPDQISSLIVYFYKNLFCEEEIIWDKVLTRSIYPQLNERQVHDLAKDVSFEEVRKAIFAISAIEALGVNGYPRIFFQRN